MTHEQFASGVEIAIRVLIPAAPWILALVFMVFGRRG